MSVVAVGTYEPAWEDRGQRVLGVDEDVTTLAVSAGLTALAAGPVLTVDRIVLVTRRPDVLEGSTASVIPLALGLDADLPVELRVGAGPATVDALTSSRSGTLVIGVDASPPAGAAAALIGGDGGADLVAAGRSGRSLPMRVQRVGDTSTRVYDDSRLERDRGWRPNVQDLSGGAAVVVGVPPREAAKLGGTGPDVALIGAAAPLFALAALADAGRDARVVALDAGEGAAMQVADVSSLAVARRARPVSPTSAGPRPPAFDAEIPLSMPAYARAFQHKIGMTGARCECGEISFPPRLVCLACGQVDTTTPHPLPRSGEVYSTVTIHAPVPGVAGPYGVAIVSLDGTSLRVLAHVTDAPTGTVGIGARGSLVLRRVAVRQGVSDYGYGFQPDADVMEAAA